MDLDYNSITMYIRNALTCMGVFIKPQGGLEEVNNWVYCIMNQEDDLL